MEYAASDTLHQYQCSPTHALPTSSPRKQCQSTRILLLCPVAVSTRQLSLLSKNKKLADSSIPAPCRQYEYKAALRRSDHKYMLGLSSRPATPGRRNCISCMRRIPAHVPHRGLTSFTSCSGSFQHSGSDGKVRRHTCASTNLPFLMYLTVALPEVRS